MKEQFEVIEIENQTMRLKLNRAVGCQGCSASGACGTGILADYFDHYSVISKPLQAGVAIGDVIIVEIATTMLYWRAFQLYIFPLLMLFMGGIIGGMLYPAFEWVQIFFAFLLFLLSFFLVKFLLK